MDEYTYPVQVRASWPDDFDLRQYIASQGVFTDWHNAHRFYYEVSDVVQRHPDTEASAKIKALALDELQALFGYLSRQEGAKMMLMIDSDSKLPLEVQTFRQGRFHTDAEVASRQSDDYVTLEGATLNLSDAMFDYGVRVAIEHAGESITLRGYVRFFLAEEIQRGGGRVQGMLNLFEPWEYLPEDITDDQLLQALAQVLGDPAPST